MTAGIPAHGFRRGRAAGQAEHGAVERAFAKMQHGHGAAVGYFRWIKVPAADAAHFLGQGAALAGGKAGPGQGNGGGNPPGQISQDGTFQWFQPKRSKQLGGAGFAPGVRQASPAQAGGHLG